jgi:hypothetical protein
MIAADPAQLGGFSRVLTDFTDSLTKEQKDDFEFSTLGDLQAAIDSIQKKQASEKKMRNLTRLKSFLEVMEQYGMVIEVFLNTPCFIAFIWVWLIRICILFHAFLIW